MTASCAIRQADLAALAAGELAGSRRDALEDHLRVCDRCRAELGGVRGILRSLPALAPPEALVDAARRRLEQRLVWMTRRRRAARVRFITGLAAAAALLLGFRLMWAAVGTEVRVPTIDPRPMVREALDRLPVEELSIGLNWMPFHETDR